MLSLSYSTKDLRKAFGSDKNLYLAKSQYPSGSLSALSPFYLVGLTSGNKKMQQILNTATVDSAGFQIVLSEQKALTSIASTFFTAIASSGSAVFNSASALSLISLTSAACLLASSSSTTTTALTASALTVFSAMIFFVLSTSIYVLARIGASASSFL